VDGKIQFPLDVRNRALMKSDISANRLTVNLSPLKTSVIFPYQVDPWTGAPGSSSQIRTMKERVSKLSLPASGRYWFTALLLQNGLFRTGFDKWRETNLSGRLSAYPRVAPLQNERIDLR
jgi:hypothetical protein